MNYMFVHLGGIPDHLIDSIRSVQLSDPGSEVFLCTDVPCILDGVNVMMMKDIMSSQTKHCMTSDYYKFDSNPLWKTALYRIFLVRDMAHHTGAERYVHFDSDVILYEPFSVVDGVVDDFEGLQITPCNEHELVFGYSVFGSKQKHIELCDQVLQIVEDPTLQRKLCFTMPNEMQILHGVYRTTNDLIRMLPTLPGETSLVFDPSSYGQYMGGTHNGDPAGWSADHHFIGREIQKGTIEPIFVDKKPYVKYNGGLCPIANLHIHSKKTKEFINAQS